MYCFNTAENDMMNGKLKNDSILQNLLCFYSELILIINQ